MNKEIKMIWKIICLDMFNTQPPLSPPKGEEKEEIEAKIVLCKKILIEFFNEKRNKDDVEDKMQEIFNVPLPLF